MIRQLIRTMEELEPLPRWSVIIDDHGYAHQRHTKDWVRCSKMHGRLRAKFLLENSLPAIVVWDPRIDTSPEEQGPYPLKNARLEYPDEARLHRSTPISDQAAAELGAINYQSIHDVLEIDEP